MKVREAAEVEIADVVTPAKHRSGISAPKIRLPVMSWRGLTIEP